VDDAQIQHVQDLHDSEPSVCGTAITIHRMQSLNASYLLAVYNVLRNLVSEVEQYYAFLN